MTARDEYIKLIITAKKRSHTKSPKDGYEVHHILPKSIFPLWKDRKSNLVTLTYEEHLQAHKLLCDIFPCKAMFMAYGYMQNQPSQLTLSEATKMLWRIPEYRQKVVDGNFKFWHDEENLKKHSEIVKAAVNKPDIAEKRNKGVRRAISQKVRNLETGKVFDSMTEAAIWAGIPKSSPKIGMCCRKERRYAGKTPEGHGASWEYVGESKRLHNNPVVIHDTVLTFTGAKNKKTNVVCWTNGVINVMSEAQPGPDFYRGMTRKSNMPS